MLNLKSSTAPWWIDSVERHIDELLIDHAHCELKAARAAMTLISEYVERTELIGELTEIVNEELDHFGQVLALLAARGVKFRRMKASSYGRRLHALVRNDEPERAIDRLLVAALIEARSCERFGLLRERLSDRDLASFYDDLFESEARHHATYVRMAKRFGAGAAVDARLEEMSAAEAAIIDEGDSLVRVHS